MIAKNISKDLFLSWGADWKYYLPACLVALVAAAIRFSLATTSSLSVDETTLVAFAHGILECGYPVIMVGTMEVPLATYELVPYPIALAISLFGQSDLSVRLPSILFAIGTTLLIYRAALRWFDLPTALLASLLYALSPWAIFWGNNCFHPAQAQFFALLTLISARTIISDPSPPAKAYFQTALCFICTYLSWEGSGFMLPILFIAGLLLNWGNWQWLQHRHLWYAVGAVAFVVVAQGVRRVLLQVGYLMVGSGKSETSLPQLTFTDSDYDPWFYIVNFFGQESNIVLSLVFVAGAFLLKNHGSLRYLYAVVAGAIFFLTNFLSFRSAHYVFWAFPFFLIAVAAATVIFCRMSAVDSLKQVYAVRISRALIIVLLLGVELAASTPYGLKLYDLVGHWQDSQRNDLRVGMAGPDYKGLSRVLRREHRAGDKIITLAPMPMQIYSGLKGDYFLSGVTLQKVVLDPGSDKPYYVDKYVGNPVLRGKPELEDFLNRNERVWLFVMPKGFFFTLQDSDLVEYINSHMKVVAESYDGTLYLWDH